LERCNTLIPVILFLRNRRELRWVSNRRRESVRYDNLYAIRW